MAATQVPPPQARSWNPNFKYTDRERWICIYPAYLNSKKSLKEGRKIPKEKCIENPTYVEIRDVLAAGSFVMGVENKVYPRELDHRDQKVRGRIRVQLKTEEGEPMMEQYPTRKSVLYYLGETIPKLKGRQHSSSSSQSGSQQQKGSKSNKKKGRKDK
ncbi:hypothetical protein ScPMuIL_002766 [Solemya velum]